ncbi:MAG TPA: hypothetical protein VK184_22045, partial [Nostocaceae cyanobacterium]|nr:hypothetical protein [Nostocaceae cyanobacterium]
GRGAEGQGAGGKQEYKNTFLFLLPIAYCLLPVAYCLFPVAYCLLPIACSLFPVPCSLPNKNLILHKYLIYL